MIALDIDKIRSIERLREELSVLLARSVCKKYFQEEVHDLVDEIYDYYGAEARVKWRKCHVM